MSSTSRRLADYDTSIREGYDLLETALTGTGLEGLLQSLKQGHLSMVKLLGTTEELYTTLDLNLRSRLERAGA